MRQFLIFTFSLVLFFKTNHLLAQPGSLDLTFGQNGKVVTDVDQVHNVPNSVLIQPDGKIVVIGYSSSAQYTSYISIIRYKKDGTLDFSFGSDGVVETVFSASDEHATVSGVLLPDGKIIAAGFTWNGIDYDFAMLRLTPDGFRDLGFGSSGVVTTDFGSKNDKANQVILQPDGKIILAGYTHDGAAYDVDMALARYHSSGILDDSFGTNGKVIISNDSEGLWQAAQSVALQTDGKILAIGYTEIWDDTNENINLEILLVRFNTNGSLDGSYGIGGVVKTEIGKRSVGTSVFSLPGGSALVLGSNRAVNGGTDDFVLVKYDTDGKLDNSFGNNGIVLTSFDNSDDVGRSLALQSDGKIVAAGYAARNNGSTLDFAISRYHADGMLDNSFGSGGKVLTDFGGNWDFGASVAIQTNGKIVVAGRSLVGNNYDFALARYNNDTALPVNLISFQLKDLENKIELFWKTSSEQDSDHFEIQRSFDGKTWEVIGSLRAAVNSEVENEYAFIDSVPASGRNFYRLKMIDHDGAYTYSSLKSLEILERNTGKLAYVFPNPAGKEVNLRLADWNTFQKVEVFNPSGAIVVSSLVPTENLSLVNLIQGEYFVVITYKNGSRTVQKIIVRE